MPNQTEAGLVFQYKSFNFMGFIFLRDFANKFFNILTKPRHEPGDTQMAN